jgi:signal peptidase I
MSQNKKSVPAPAAAPVHRGPGTGVPNPNYSYSSKPSILGTGLQRDIMSLLIKIAVIVGIVVALFTFVFGVFQYSSAAMNPAVKSGDLILFSRFDRAYASQDLVVVSYQGEMQVRRVVAVGGDIVDFDDEALIVNGARQQEPDIFVPTQRFESEISFPLTVPQGHIFVLGDYRESAIDSRIYGTIAVDDSQGKVISIFRRRGF